MGFFDSVFSNAPKGLALDLADKVAKQFPPTSEKQLDKKGAQRRLEGVVSALMRDIEAVQAQSKFNWIAKARFGTAFKWALLDKGYSKSFSDALTEGVIRSLVIK